MDLCHLVRKAQTLSPQFSMLSFSLGCSALTEDACTVVGIDKWAVGVLYHPVPQV